jgi:hypothetical protein
VVDGGNRLAEDTSAVIAQFIDELSSIHHHEPELVARTLGYLAAAKNGLSAKELTEVLSRDVDVMRAVSSEQHGARTTKLPAAVWVRLHRDLAPFLVEKRIDEQPLMQFFHRQVAQVVGENHFAPTKMALHGRLAAYFDEAVRGADARAGKSDGQDRTIYPVRSLSELPYQLFRAGQRSRLDEILMAPDWMQQKLNAFGPQSLVDDYEQFGQGQMQNIIGRTLRLTTGICARDQRQLLPQLVGRLMTCVDPAAPAFLSAARDHIRAPSILTRRPSLTPPGAEVARLEGHSDGVTALAVLTDGRLASGSNDPTVRLWDVRTGAEVARLEGHSHGVTALAVLPDGRLASAG